MVKKDYQEEMGQINRIIKDIERFGRNGLVAHIRLRTVTNLDLIETTVYNAMVHMEKKYSAVLLRTPSNDIIAYATAPDVAKIIRDDVLAILYPLNDIGVDVSTIVTFYSLAAPHAKTEVLALLDRIRTGIQSEVKHASVSDYLNINNIGTIYKMIDAIPNGLLSKLVMRQPIVNVSEGEAKILSNEYYLSMKTLQRVMPNDVVLIKPPLLFMSLFGVLDQKIMSFFQSKIIRTNVNINLSLETLVSDKFNVIDGIVGDKADHWTIEIHSHDVFADLDTTFAVCEKLHKKGYKIALDGLSLQSMILTDLSSFPFDYFKFNWSNSYSRSAKKIIEATVFLIGNERIILAKTDSQEAIKYGLSLGIENFQGFFFDHMLRKAKK